MKGTKTYEISCPLSIMELPGNFTEETIAEALEKNFCCKFIVKELKQPVEEKPAPKLTGHGKIVCKVCGALIAQCRCIDCGSHIEYSTCAKCSAGLKSKE